MRVINFEDYIYMQSLEHIFNVDITSTYAHHDWYNGLLDTKPPNSPVTLFINSKVFGKDVMWQR